MGVCSVFATLFAVDVDDGCVKGDVLPVSFMFCGDIQGSECSRTLSVLFDSGATESFMKRACLPKNVTPLVLPQRETKQTLAGPLTVKNAVNVSNLVFPEFNKSLKVASMQCKVFDQECTYDVILGRDFLQEVKMDICFSVMNQTEGCTRAFQFQ